MNYFVKSFGAHKVNFLAFLGLVLVIWQTVHKFGLLFAIGLTLLLLLFLILPQLSVETRLFLLIGSAILPFDSLFSSIPILERFGRSAPVIVITIGCFITHKVAVSDKSKIQISIFKILGIAIISSIFIVRYGQIPRNILFLLCIVLYIQRLSNYNSSKVLILNDYPKVLSITVGIYSFLLFIFQNPIQLILQGHYIDKLNPDANPGRLVGFGGDYEVLGLTLAIGLVSSYFMMITSHSRRRLIYVLATVFTGISLLATASITSLLLVTIGILILESISLIKSQKNKSKKRFLRFLVLISFFVVAVQVTTKRLTQRNIFPLNSSQNYSFSKILDRQSVWGAIMNSNSWNPHSLLGLGWPYPYDTFGTWPHSTFLDLWIIGGVPLLIVGLIGVLFILFYIIKGLKNGNAIFSVFTLMLLLGSVTIDLIRSTSLIFLTLTILFLLNSRKESGKKTSIRDNLLKVNCMSSNSRDMTSNEFSKEK